MLGVGVGDFTTDKLSIMLNPSCSKCWVLALEILQSVSREHSGSVVECLARDRVVAGSSLTYVAVLCP